MNLDFVSLKAARSLFKSKTRLDAALERAALQNAMWGLPRPLTERGAGFELMAELEALLNHPLPKSYRLALRQSNGVAWLWKRVSLLSLEELAGQGLVYERMWQLKRKYLKDARVGRSLLIGCSMDLHCDAMLLLDLTRSDGVECPVYAFDGVALAEHASFQAFLEQL